MTTSAQPLSPILLQPVLVEKPWGGDWLATRLGKPADPGLRWGESWEAVALRDTSNPIASGPGAGGVLGDLLAGREEEILGPAAAAELAARGKGGLPILFKYLHAVEDLSLQVHPDTEQAMRISGLPEGKTEAWRILDAEPDAGIWIGCREGVTEARLREALAEGDGRGALDCLQRWPAEPGATYLVRAGTIHTVGRGVLFAEVQQASDLTYRFTDFGRKGTDGRARPLHLDDAFAVARIAPADGCRLDGAVEPEISGGVRREVHRCGPFVFEVLEGEGAWEGQRGGGFEIVSAARGEAGAAIDGGAVELRRGATALLPAGEGPVRLTLRDATVVRAYLP